MNPAMRKTASRHAVAARVAVGVAVGVIAPLLLGGCVIAAAPMGGRPQIVKAAPASGPGPASGSGPVQKGAADAAAALALAVASPGRASGLDRHAGLSAWPAVRIAALGDTHISPTDAAGLGVDPLPGGEAS